jgi:hypothetical protein
MSTDREPEASHTIVWNMLDDSQFLLRPGFKFPVALSYKQVCQQVNKQIGSKSWFRPYATEDPKLHPNRRSKGTKKSIVLLLPWPTG